MENARTTSSFSFLLVPMRARQKLDSVSDELAPNASRRSHIGEALLALTLSWSKVRWKDWTLSEIRNVALNRA